MLFRIKITREWKKERGAGGGFLVGLSGPQGLLGYSFTFGWATPVFAAALPCPKTSNLRESATVFQTTGVHKHFVLVFVLSYGEVMKLCSEIRHENGAK